VSGLTHEELSRPSDFYARRGSELSRQAEESAARYARYTQILVLVGLFACLALYESVIAKRLPFWAAMLVVPAGAWVVQKRHLCHVRSVEFQSLLEYYEKGKARLARKWDSLDTGEKFIDPAHFYAEDLNLFGNGSLYQLLCSARTRIGQQTLADWMKSPANGNQVRGRQEAVSELRPRRDLPESIAAAGAMRAGDFRAEFFRMWVAEPPAEFPRLVAPAAVVLALAALAAPILFWSKFLDSHGFWQMFISLLAIDGVLALALRSRVKPILESLPTLSVELPIMCELFRIMEREQFSSASLKTLAERLGRNTPAASAQVQRLLGLIRLASLREKEWFAYLSFCLLWGTQFAIAIERWRRRHGRQMLDWVTSLGELEALISLSTYCYEHPSDTFPELTGGGADFEGEGLGHPLLEETSCIRNNVRLDDSVRFLIVSGSNMSGKSTFLRAIGANAVLAFMGASVRCTKLRLSELAIGAATRMQDSMVDGRSHFLAEMERLRRMIDAAERGPLLFLADEIMSGTNSHDRRIAAEWVVQALVMRRAIGVITTHDLALTEIANNGLPGRNVCFEDAGEFGSLSFDYKLREGVLKRSNALNIARLLGIDKAAGLKA
jgi:MutS domain V